MSERKISKKNQKTRPPNPISSPRRSTLVNRRSKPPKPIKVDIQRCSSEPILWTIGVVSDENENHKSKFDAVVFNQSCMDIFVPPFMSPIASNFERYKTDTKVVVNVTVEGSPGPVRTLVKLGASVEETIKLIVNKYSEEGRSPHLSRDGVSSYELHHSHFSLESINKKDTIGDVGTRSFYLRKSCNGHTSNGISQLVSFSSASEVLHVKPIPPLVSPFAFMPPFISRKISKIGRRMCKLWKILGCGPSG